MGHAEGFNFESPEAVWNEVRSVWPAGAGISYRRLEHGGLQWPCPDESHPGTAILHADAFPGGRKAPLQCIPFEASTEASSETFPFLLVTGRTLYAFNAGTMTSRTPNRRLRGADTLDMEPGDAARLRFQEGDRVRVRSRHGEAVLPVRLDPRVRSGELFATFHTGETFLNEVTGPCRDRVVMTPGHKVVAVNVERSGG